jgi:hypothetical protein
VFSMLGAGAASAALILGGAGGVSGPISMRGADAVSAALTLGGAGGVSGLMDYFNQELVNTTLLLGVDKVAALGREHVTRGPGF